LVSRDLGATRVSETAAVPKNYMLHVTPERGARKGIQIAQSANQKALSM
jgi:hypothetical protein